MRILTSMLLLSIATAAHAQGFPTPTIKDVPGFPKLPKVTLLTISNYDAALHQAKREGKPLVVFVRSPAHEVRGAITVRDDGFDGQTFFMLPDGRFFALSKGQWSAQDIADEIAARTGVSRQATPFEFASRQTADGRPFLAVSENDRLMEMWPKTVSKEGFRFYRQTRKSQRIAITNEVPTNQWYDVTQDDNWGNALPSLNPNRRDRRWVAPGGLHGVDGWRSYTAVHLPDRVQTWTQPLPIANGGIIPGGKRWAYPDGTVFADLLTKDGKAFELRMREKQDGRWDSFVAYKNSDAAPVGYHGAGRKCAECHDGAGSSEQYGILVRGSDTVFSFNPFD